MKMSSNEAQAYENLSLPNRKPLEEAVKVKGSSPFFLDINFYRKSMLLIVMILTSNPLSLLLIGLLNRLLFSPINSVFICYPAHEKYTKNYGFDFMVPLIKRYPVIAGGFFQGGKFGLICFISSVESEFKQDDFFPVFTKWTNRLSKFLGVNSVNYSGVLPSSMKRAKYMEQSELDERCVIVGDVVVNSEKAVRDLTGYSVNCPIILLGGGGSIGQEITKTFLEQGREVYIVDKNDKLPERIKNKKSILIDVARKGALEKHMGNFWEGLIVLNETYPEPSKEVIAILRDNNIPLYHIAGVKALALPKFPHAYAGGLPCCAMNPAANVKPLIRLLC